MTSAKISFLLVDDHSQVRKSLKDLIEINSSYQVVAEAGDGETAIAMATELNPDIIFVDINMKPMDGFTVTEAIIQLLPSVKIIGFSAHSDPWHAAKMISLGAKGYLSKNISFDELHLALEKIIAGEQYISGDVKKK